MTFRLQYFINNQPHDHVLTEKSYSVGKLKGLDISLKDNTVSRHHCRLTRSGDSYEITDSNSTNGTYVNNRRIKSRILQSGDEIKIGRTKIYFFQEGDSRTFEELENQKISMELPLSEEISDSAQIVPAPGTDSMSEFIDLGKKLLSSSSLTDTFAFTGDMIARILKPEHLLIFSYDRVNRDLHLQYSRDRQGHAIDKITFSKTIAMKAIKKKVAILSANTKFDKRFDNAESVILYGITSAVSVPIWTKTSIYGLIYADTSSLDQIFTENNLKIISAIANYTGLSVESLSTQFKLDQEKKIRSRLERYHSPAVVSRIMETQDSGTMAFQLHKETEATVLFMDMVAFTARTEKMKPVDVGVLLNQFFSEMTDVIFHYNGTLDKYIGDGIMAVFGVPFFTPDHSELAIRAAIDMLAKLEEINRVSGNRDPIRIRIGINSGKLISGDFGSPRRYDFTVLGSTVNIASRIESTVAGADEIVVTDPVFRKTRSLFEFTPLGPIAITGISVPVKSYKVLGLKGEI